MDTVVDRGWTYEDFPLRPLRTPAFLRKHVVRQLRPTGGLPAGPAGGRLARARWRRYPAVGGGRRWRATGGYRALRQTTAIERTCNWAVPADDDDSLCVSCRITRVIPNLGSRGQRRPRGPASKAPSGVCLFTLMELGLPCQAVPTIRTAGWRSSFSPTLRPGGPPVLTGHADGVITINIAEADDAERERRRAAMGEPYRTLLGHMRHESGHYYWDRCISGTATDLDAFRSICSATNATTTTRRWPRYYQNGARPEWQDQFVSAYATAHPWEDWAETWAHYLHMVDTLETAAACGLSLKPRRTDEPALNATPYPCAAARRVRPADRQLVSADLHAEQPESRPGSGCVPLRALAAGHRQAAVCS